MSQNIDFAFCSFTFLFLPLSTSSKSGLALNFNYSRPWGKDKFRYSGYGDSVSLHVVKVKMCKKIFFVSDFFLNEMLHIQLRSSCTHFRGSHYLEVGEQSSFESFNALLHILVYINNE